VTPRHLTIVECRPPWRQDMGAEWTRFPIARLRYTKATGRWSLYWRDHHLRFHLYDRIAASPRIDDLLREIDRDPTGIFCGWVRSTDLASNTSGTPVAHDRTFPRKRREPCQPAMRWAARRPVRGKMSASAWPFRFDDQDSASIGASVTRSFTASASCRSSVISASAWS
jgi:Protein of unknown function (DUF3024)